MWAPWLQAPYAQVQARLADDALPHALLLHGPAGWGQLLLADAIALQIIAKAPAEPGSGPSAAELAHQDLRWIEPDDKSGQTRIDLVRELGEFAQHRPQSAPRKVAVITAAETMNAAATNALLKTLEEPPPDTFILLVTAALGDLLPTIRSRCMLLPVHPVTAIEALEWVRKQWPGAAPADLESLSFELGAAPMALLEALEAGQEPVGPLLDTARSGRQTPAALANALASADLEDLLQRWIRYVADALQAGLTGGRPKLGALAEVAPEALLDCQDQLLHARQLVHGTSNPNPRLLLETLLVYWRDLGRRHGR
jgi:DNA polymerase III subunit delta'